MKTPSELHYKSEKKFIQNLEDLNYPIADEVGKVNLSGDLYHKNKRIYISRSLAGYNLGITEQDEGIYSVHFMDYQLGFFDFETRKVLSVENPFILPKV